LFFKYNPPWEKYLYFFIISLYIDDADQSHVIGHYFSSLVGNVVEHIMKEAFQELAKMAWNRWIGPGLEATWNKLKSWFARENNQQINNQIPTMSAVNRNL